MLLDISYIDSRIISGNEKEDKTNLKIYEIKSKRSYQRMMCLKDIGGITVMDKTSISMFEILEPGGSALGKYSI